MFRKDKSCWWENRDVDVDCNLVMVTVRGLDLADPLAAVLGFGSFGFLVATRMLLLDSNRWTTNTCVTEGCANGRTAP